MSTQPSYPETKFLEGKRLQIRRMISRQFKIQASITDENYAVDDSTYFGLSKLDEYSLEYVLAVFNSNLLSWYQVSGSAIALRDDYPKLTLTETNNLPIPRINFATSTDKRKRLTISIVSLYETNRTDHILKEVQAVLGSGQTDVVHNALAFLAQQMLDLNKSKQTQVKRFLTWLETTLKIKPNKDGDKSIDGLKQKTRLQNYLGDYQKGDKEVSFDEYYDALYQNRNRFNVLLSDVKAAIETEYAASLKTLLPIKDQLARTDLLIDQIVYKLYGLTDEEIALIERPQVEQAIADAKAFALADEALKDNPEAALEYIAEAIEPALTRLNTLSPSQAAQSALDTALPAWRNLSERVRTFLSEAERDLLDDTRADYTGSVVNFAKAVEVTLNEKLFLPFRAAGYNDSHVVNEKAFKPFMRGGKPIMLGSVDYCLSSTEKVFRGFILTLYADAATRIFEKTGIRGFLTQDQVGRRNGAAHEAIMTLQDAQDARTWALSILSFL